MSRPEPMKAAKPHPLAARTQSQQEQPPAGQPEPSAGSREERSEASDPLVPFNSRIPDSLRKELRRQAFEQDRPAQQLLIEALRDKLGK